MNCFSHSQRMLASVCLLAVVHTGCAAKYSGMYKQTKSADQAAVPTADVKVAKTAADVDVAWTELGSYRGHAPTTQEAVDLGRAECGRHGADWFILNTPPFQSEGAWKVDGICARTQGT